MIQRKKLYYKHVREYDKYLSYENGDLVTTNRTIFVTIIVRENRMSLAKNGNQIYVKATRVIYETWHNKKLKKSDFIRFRDGDKTNLHYTNLINSSDNNLTHLILDRAKEWKFVKNYPNYKSSNYGDIFSIKSNKLLTPQLSGTGYLCIKLTNNLGNIRIYIHLIVYQTFVGEITKDKVIDHKNRIKLDNFVDNLREVTYSENNKNIDPYCRRGYVLHQYSLDDIFIKEWTSLKEVSESLKIDKLKIRDCCQNLIEEYEGFKWFYPEKVLDTSDFYAIEVGNGKTYSKFRIHENSDIINSKGMIMKYDIHTQYKRIKLMSDGDNEWSMFYVHVLVAKTFMPNNNKEYTIVNHLDENKLNAHVSNLQ